MRHFSIFVLLVLLQISPTLKAEDTAECTVLAGFDYPDPGYKSPRRSLSKVLDSGELISLEESSEKCFQRAITFCSQFPTFGSINIEKEFDGMYKSTVTVKSHVYCKWEFDDGYIDDSTGLVTKYTNKNNYSLDDARVNFDNAEYEQPF